MDFKVDLNLTPDLIVNLNDTEMEIDKILSEIKDELVGNDDLHGSAVDSSLPAGHAGLPITAGKLI